MSDEPILLCGFCHKKDRAEVVSFLARYKCKQCNKINEVTNISLREWLGFNYEEYLRNIIEQVDKDPFKHLSEELSERDIYRMRSVFKTSFQKGSSIKVIAKRLKEDVFPKDDLYRAVTIARTETTRLSNLGAQKHYKEEGVEQYRWIAALSDRTCPLCTNLNGQIFEIGGGEMPPKHTNCRCSIGAITALEKQ